MSRNRPTPPRALGAIALLLAAALGCSGSDDAVQACNEGTLRCSGNRIEVCSALFVDGVSTTEWIQLVDCEETEEEEETAQECTTNASRCGGIGPCCAD